MLKERLEIVSNKKALKMFLKCNSDKMLYVNIGENGEWNILERHLNDKNSFKLLDVLKEI